MGVVGDVGKSYLWKFCRCDRVWGAEEQVHNDHFSIINSTLYDAHESSPCQLYDKNIDSEFSIAPCTAPVVKNDREKSGIQYEYTYVRKLSRKFGKIVLAVHKPNALSLSFRTYSGSTIERLYKLPEKKSTALAPSFEFAPADRMVTYLSYLLVFHFFLCR